MYLVTKDTSVKSCQSKQQITEKNYHVKNSGQKKLMEKYYILSSIGNIWNVQVKLFLSETLNIPFFISMVHLLNHQKESKWYI